MAFLDRHWYRLSWLSLLLLPLAAAFGSVVAVRRALFRAGILASHRMPVPVIVVGNITVGGTGKTPLVLWLSDFLRSQGYAPGIVSRGYGGRGQTMAVRPGTAADVAGDEPVLLAQRSRCPVWIGRDRVAAAQALLAVNPACDVIISDDGLQHYRLQRDVEIAVTDGSRGIGNGLPLPAGPLRENAGRLAHVDALVVNGDGVAPVSNVPAFPMTLEGSVFRNLLNPEFLQQAAAFHGKRIHAVAGIGNPARYFDHLRRLGLSFAAHAFADHHAYTQADLEFDESDAIIMTEKDAIKCMRFARENHWVMPVDACVDPRLGRLILEKLKTRHGS
ncbi:MAG TPA: tetraacyldisaccharide 4'-kinase [Burkholderiales bacterium]